MKLKYAPENDSRLKTWKYESEARKMLNFIGENDVILDIGANIMDHSCYFGEKLQNSKIYSFEPVKEYYDMGVLNIKYNKLTNISPYNLAVDKISGNKVEINVNNEGSSINSNESNRKEIVKTISIDDFVKKNNLSPNFIKIDVEGYALNVLKGMEKTLKNPNLTIVMEPHPVFLSFNDVIKKFEFLYKNNYQVISKIKNREFIFQKKNSGVSIKKIKRIIAVQRKVFLRVNFDKAKKSTKLKEIIKEFRSIKAGKVNPITWLIWSRIYRFLWFKNRNLNER